MARLSILAICGLAALVAAGCGSGEDSGSATGASSAAATESSAEDGAMKNDGEAMEHEGAAMKNDGEAMASKRGSRPGKKIEAVGSSYGRVIADGRGEAFYLFGKETSKRSRCYGACARAWPPAITKGKPRAGKGVKARLLGTTRRRDGKLQVTYKGHPLYYYVDDSPGQILCQNVSEFGGLWLVVKPSGNPVT